VLGRLDKGTERGLRMLEGLERRSVQEAQRQYEPSKHGISIAKARSEPAMGKKRILYVSNPSGFSARKESLCQMIGHLDKQEFEKNGLDRPRGRFWRAAARAGLPSSPARPTLEKIRPITFITAFSILQETQADLVHMNGPHSLPMVLAANLLHIPMVLHVRNGEMEL